MAIWSLFWRDTQCHEQWSLVQNKKKKKKKKPLAYMPESI